MSVAMVRIARVENWCERAMKAVQRHVDNGRVAFDLATDVRIGIETNSMQVINGERAWLVVKVPRDVEFVDGRMACEHMLVMD